MEFINTIAAEHKRWVYYVNSFGEHNYAEDIVQEMYIKLYEAEQREYNPNDKRFKNPLKMSERVINADGTVNVRYVFLTLYSLYMDFAKERNKVEKVSTESLNLEAAVEDIENEIAYGEILNKLDTIKEGWHWYDKMLFNLYSKTELSLRELADETKIGVGGIWQDITRCKKAIKDGLEEDYKSYINN